MFNVLCENVQSTELKCSMRCKDIFFFLYEKRFFVEVNTNYLFVSPSFYIFAHQFTNLKF